MDNNRNLEKLRSWMLTSKYDSILLESRANYSWLMDGAESQVLETTSFGVACLFITATTIHILADCSDASRLAKEQNPWGYPVIEFPWWQSLAQGIEICLTDSPLTFANLSLASDSGVLNTPNVQSELIPLRLTLSDSEIERYRQLGQDAARVVEEVCRQANVGGNEIDIANRVKSACLFHGIQPDCVLVGSDQRLSAYRHPMPTDKTIEQSLMVVLGGRRHGLNVSLTRIVYFTPPPLEIIDKYQKNARIFAAMQCALKDGLSYRNYFKAIQNFYQQAAHPDEWQAHHQGGPTAYNCRELVITANTGGNIGYNQVFAWNPTIAGVKCEDTTLLTATGVETLTDSGKWPRSTIKTEQGSYPVADILVK